jgi:hypothetical protein
MKKFHDVALCLALTLGASGCGGCGGVPPNAKKDPTITIPPSNKPDLKTETHDMRKQRASEAIQNLLTQLDKEGLKCLLGRVDEDSEKFLRTFMEMLERDATLPAEKRQLSLILPTHFDKSSLLLEEGRPPRAHFGLQRSPVTKQFALRVEKEKVWLFLGENVPASENISFAEPVVNLSADPQILLKEVTDLTKFQKAFVNIGGKPSKEPLTMLEFVGLNTRPDQVVRIDVRRIDNGASPNHFQLQVMAWERAIPTTVELSDDFSQVTHVREIAKHTLGQHIKVALAELGRK